MRKMQRKRDSLVLTLIICTITFSICLLNKVEASSTTTQYTATSSETTTGISSTQQGTTTTSLDTTTQSETSTASTQQGTTAATLGTTTQSETGTATTQQGTTTTSLGTTTQSETGTATIQQGTTTTSLGTTTQSETGTSSTQQGTTATSSDTTTHFSSNETVTLPTTATIGMNGTPNETATTTGAMTTQSTTTLTTTITTGQTTTLPPYMQPPNFGAAPPFKIDFTIGFNKTWTTGFGNPLSEEYRSFKYKVDQEIDKAFQGCPGYIPYSANVTGFYPNVSAIVATHRKVRSVMRSEGLQTLSTDGYVHAAYQTSYDNKAILEGGEATTKYIDEQTIPKLLNVTIDGSVGVLNDSLEDMSTTANSSVSALQGDPCQAIGTYICTVCYPCGSTSPTNVTCVATCRDDNKVCTVTGSNTTGCNCKNKYLPVGDGCVHENVIIGATTGVVGAVLLVLVIAVIILCCKPKKKEIQTMSYERMRTYELVKVPTADKAVATAEGESVELVTFPRNQNVLAKSDSNGAAPITKERASSVSSYDTKSISNSDRLPSEKQHVSPYQYYPFTFGKELRDEDLPKEITSSEVFVDFAPRLDNVDPYAEYSIRRPAALLKQKNNSTMPVEADSFF